MIRGTGICLLILVFAIYSAAQTNSELPFVRDELNYVDNHSQGLKNLYHQLSQLENGRSRKVTIVHIGDSHLQADWFSGRFRLEMHKRFGSAGRGLVFPYRVAKTNSPPDIKSYSNVNWETKRNISLSNPMPVGISGISIRTKQPNFFLAMDIAPNEYDIDYSFNKITVFSEKGANCYDFVLSDHEGVPQSGSSPVVATHTEDKTYHTVKKGQWLGLIAKEYGTTIANIKEWNGLTENIIFPNQRLVVSKTTQPAVARKLDTSDFTVIDNSNELLSSHSSKVWLSRPVNCIFLSGKKTDIHQQEALIHGMSLENDINKGILYHMIGVNGAQIKHYNASTYFMTQLRELHPDLIIVSLGTNETYSTGFNVNQFYRELDQFVHDLETTMPLSDILLTTPPDAYYARKYVNRRIRNAKNTLLSYAINNGHACWDFYDIMGGEGSILKWNQYGLAQRDKLHLTKSGYELQGKLLFEALTKGYEAYRSVRP